MVRKKQQPIEETPPVSPPAEKAKKSGRGEKMGELARQVVSEMAKDFPVEGRESKLEPDFDYLKRCGYIVTVEGKQYVTCAGLVDLAWRKGSPMIETREVQLPDKDLTDNMAVVFATVRITVKSNENGKPVYEVLGPFTGLGDANTENAVGKNMRLRLLRVAERRAIARALQLALNFLGLTALEELEDDDDSGGDTIAEKAETKNAAEQSAPLSFAEAIRHVSPVPPAPEVVKTLAEKGVQVGATNLKPVRRPEPAPPLPTQAPVDLPLEKEEVVIDRETVRERVIERLHDFYLVESLAVWVAEAREMFISHGMDPKVEAKHPKIAAAYTAKLRDLQAREKEAAISDWDGPFQ